MRFNGRQWFAYCDECRSKAANPPDSFQTSAILSVYSGRVGRYNPTQGSGRKAPAGRKKPVTVTLTLAVLERLDVQMCDRSSMVELALRQQFGMPLLEDNALETALMTPSPLSKFTPGQLVRLHQPFSIDYAAMQVPLQALGIKTSRQWAGFTHGIIAKVLNKEVREVAQVALYLYDPVLKLIYLNPHDGMPMQVDFFVDELALLDSDTSESTILLQDVPSQ